MLGLVALLGKCFKIVAWIDPLIICSDCCALLAGSVIHGGTIQTTRPKARDFKFDPRLLLWLPCQIWLEMLKRSSVDTQLRPKKNFYRRSLPDLP